MAYQPRFQPGTITGRDGTSGFPDDSDAYVFDNEDVRLAIDVALVTGRPLLVHGPAGSGKSSLGPNVARELGWEWDLQVVSARTEPEDLLWRFDALQRLNDAQAKKLNPDDQHYYRPGLLWHAFAAQGRFVAVIDEIDKADPDIPSSLLRPLGSLTFETPWGSVVAADKERPPLIVITTNNERQLSRPFLRRCVAVELRSPSPDHLRLVARCHLRDDYDAEVVDGLIALMGDDPDGLPSTAEFLDSVKASVQLGITPGTPDWDRLAAVTLLKTLSEGRPR